MRFLKNYWFRWFFGAFIIGFILVPIFLFGSAFYLHFSTVAQFDAQAIPAILVTNPFVEITSPSSGKIIASGNLALVVASFLSGLATGFVGLGIAVVKHFIIKSPR